MKFGIRSQLTDVITCVKFLVDRFRGYAVLTPPKLPFPIDLLRRPYNSVALPCDTVKEIFPNAQIDLWLIMRPSSLGGGRIMRHTLSVCPSVPLADVLCCTVLRANIQNRKTSVFAYGPASRMYFSARAEGRISYGHLSRTNSCLIIYQVYK